jgi:hypothetical protein
MEAYDKPIVTPPDVIDAVFHWVQSQLPVNNDLLYLGFRGHYAKSVSNSHSAPWNGKTNWGGQKPDIPRGYPGFDGRIWMIFRTEDFNNKPWYGHSSDLIEKTRLYSGSGGAGDYNNPLTRGIFYDKLREKYPGIYPLGWDGRFYLDDWPELKVGLALEQWHMDGESMLMQTVNEDFRPYLNSVRQDAYEKRQRKQVNMVKAAGN